MDGRGLVIGGKTDQVPIRDLFDRTDSLIFQEGIERVEPGG